MRLWWLSFLLITSFASTQARGIWLDVPYIRQEANGCGAASIAMVLQYWAIHGHSMPQQRMDSAEIMKALYSPGRKGIVAVDMQRYLEQQGFQVFAFSGRWSDLERHLSRGRPLIVCLEENGPRGRLHYVVVAGLSSEEGILLVNDPAQRKLMKMERATFEKSWRQNWTLLAVPENAQ